MKQKYAPVMIIEMSLYPRKFTQNLWNCPEDHLSVRQEQEGNRPPVCYLETDSQPNARYRSLDICQASSILHNGPVLQKLRAADDSTA